MPNAVLSLESTSALPLSEEFEQKLHVRRNFSYCHTPKVASSAHVAYWPLSTVRGNAIKRPELEDKPTLGGHRELVEFDPSRTLVKRLQALHPCRG